MVEEEIQAVMKSVALQVFQLVLQREGVNGVSGL